MNKLGAVVVLVFAFLTMGASPVLVDRIGPAGARETLAIMKGSNSELLITSVGLPKTQVVLKKSGWFSSSYLITNLAGASIVEVSPMGSSFFSGGKKFFSRSTATGEMAVSEVTSAGFFSRAMVRTTRVSSATTLGVLTSTIAFLDFMFGDMQKDQQCCEAMINSDLWKELYPPGSYAFFIDPGYTNDWTPCKIWVTRRYGHTRRTAEEIEDICEEFFPDCESRCVHRMHRLENTLMSTGDSNVNDLCRVFDILKPNSKSKFKMTGRQSSEAGHCIQGYH